MCYIVTLTLGVLLVIGSCVISFAIFPHGVHQSVIHSLCTQHNARTVKDNIVMKPAHHKQLILYPGSVQSETFLAVPMDMSFKVHMFNITNPEEVLAGAAPALQQIGPYVYKMDRQRVMEGMFGDIMRYHMLDQYEFDAEASFPYSENDQVTVVNVPYNTILQSVEASSTIQIESLSAALDSVFGDHNSPVSSFRVGDLTFGDGVKVCEVAGQEDAEICSQVTANVADAKNFAVGDDGSLSFSFFGYRNGNPSVSFDASRGMGNYENVGLLVGWGGETHLDLWAGGQDSLCNMINGTDSAIYPPFIDTSKSLYAFHHDICRSVELKSQYKFDVEGLSVQRFKTDSALLDNHEGCFCLGQTAADGCLLQGAMELNTCLGSSLVLSYPHFLYADATYAQGVVGLTPLDEDHTIVVDIEPTTGRIVSSVKRSQHNVFLRPVPGVASTQALPNTLTPVFWIEESMTLPDEARERLKSRLYLPLTVVPLVTWLSVSFSCVVLLAGIVCLVLRLRNKPTDKEEA